MEMDIPVVTVARFHSRTAGLLDGIVSLAVTVPVIGVILLMGQWTEVRGLNAICRHVDTVSTFITISACRVCLSVCLTVCEVKFESPMVGYLLHVFPYILTMFCSCLSTKIIES